MTKDIHICRKPTFSNDPFITDEDIEVLEIVRKDSKEAIRYAKAHYTDVTPALRYNRIWVKDAK